MTQPKLFTFKGFKKLDAEEVIQQRDRLDTYVDPEACSRQVAMEAY